MRGHLGFAAAVRGGCIRTDRWEEGALDVSALHDARNKLRAEGYVAPADRGRVSEHRIYGEALCLLDGDALYTQLSVLWMPGERMA
jgi:hypothetical protein